MLDNVQTAEKVLTQRLTTGSCCVLGKDSTARPRQAGPEGNGVAL